MEYLDSVEEGGMNDVQVVEVKRPRCSTYVPACKNLRKDPISRKKMAIKSSRTYRSNTPPHALRVSISLSQDAGNDLRPNVDVSPPTSESEQVICPTYILVLDSQKPIVDGALEPSKKMILIHWHKYSPKHCVGK